MTALKLIVLTLIFNQIGYGYKARSHLEELEIIFDSTRGCLKKRLEPNNTNAEATDTSNQYI